MINPILKKQFRELKKAGLKINFIPAYHVNYFLLKPDLWLNLPNFSIIKDTVIPGVDAFIASTNIKDLEMPVQKKVKSFFGKLIGECASGAASVNQLDKLLRGKETAFPPRIILDNDKLRKVGVFKGMRKMKNNIVETNRNLTEGSHKIRITDVASTKLLPDTFIDYVKEESLNVKPEDKEKFNLFFNILRDPCLLLKIDSTQQPFVFYFDQMVKNSFSSLKRNENWAFTNSHSYYNWLNNYNQGSYEANIIHSLIKEVSYDSDS